MVVHTDMCGGPHGCVWWSTRICVVVHMDVCGGPHGYVWWSTRMCGGPHGCVVVHMMCVNKIRGNLLSMYSALKGTQDQYLLSEVLTIRVGLCT